METITEEIGTRTITIENYQLHPHPSADPRDSTDARTQLCLLLGLPAQFQTCPYPELTGEELSVWSQFLPRTYGWASRHDRPDGSMMLYEGWRPELAETPRFNYLHVSAYRFDNIPLWVLNRIADVRNAGLFDDIQIWTPEKALIKDPIAVGVVGARENTRYFLLCRWGESLRPFEEIRRHIFSKSQKEKVVPPDSWKAFFRYVFSWG